MQRERLTAEELAGRSGTTPARIRELVEAGVLRPDESERFVPADAQRVQVAAAYVRGGIDLPLLARAIRDGFLSFEFTDRIYPESSPPSGRTLGDLMADLGDAGAILPDLLLAMGLAQPTPERPLTIADEKAIRQFAEAWTAAPLAAGAALRAARLAGDATRRAAEGWTELFIEANALPPEQSTALSMDELEVRLFQPAARVAQAFEPTFVWLLRHHLEQALNVANVEAMERSLEVEGVRPRADREPPAIVFADIAGFTRLVDEHGDEVAVRHAEELGVMAARIATANGGRLVKQLGDGVMLAFERAAAAADAAVDLLRAAASTGLPALHIGISAGPVVERDGDFYGRTVNLAARLSSIAGPGEVVLNEAAAGGLGSARVVAAPSAQLKGIAAPVAVFRLDTTMSASD